MPSANTGLAPDRDGNSSLLMRIGGKAGLDALVGAFYFNVLRDDRVAHSFSGVNIEASMNHQRQLLTIAFDDDDPSPGPQLRVLHRRLVESQGLGERHFDALIQILATTLDDLGHKGDLARSIIGRLAALGDDVLDHGSGSTSGSGP